MPRGGVGVAGDKREQVAARLDQHLLHFIRRDDLCVRHPVVQHLAEVGEGHLVSLFQLVDMEEHLL